MKTTTPRENPGIRRLIGFINSYPMLFGTFLGVLLILAVIITQTWFPRVIEGLGNHKSLAEGVLYTSLAFCVCAYTFRRWRHQNPHVFWASLGIFFLFHSFGVFLYSIKMGTIKGLQWAILLYLESYLAAFFVGWSTRRFRRSFMNMNSRRTNDQGHTTD